jgi:peptidoglycan/xylan/chitin deacetylase (PgdA/CDA1 family)
MVSASAAATCQSQEPRLPAAPSATTASSGPAAIPSAGVVACAAPACDPSRIDPTPVHVRPRALLLGPKYVWTDAKFDVDNIVAALDQAGVPYDVQPASRPWETLTSNLAQYALLIIPGYLETGSLPQPMLAALESFATQGGVVVVMKPIGDVDEPETLRLTGLLSTVHRPTTTEIRIDGPAAPALAAIDSPEERQLSLVDAAQPAPMDVWTYDPDPTSKTVALAHAFAGTVALGAVATRRPLGRGAIYSWGHDLTTFDGMRCYVNCFEPAGDVLRLFLRDALREGAAGHVILAHIVPGPSDSTLILTHDVDAPDAYSAGPWGEPGALRMAAMEKRLGVRATYNITTDYVAGYFRPEVLRALCDEGMCPLGDHSVRHLVNFDRLPRGDCRETRATYRPAEHPTVCGEVRVPLEIVTSITGERPRVWRSGYLLVNSFLFDALAENGFETASDFGVGDLKYNLPVDAAKIGILQQTFHHRSIFEFPLVCEDGMGSAAFKRVELQQSNVETFEAAWENALLRNADNGSITTALVHPSRGRDVPDDNLQVKIDAVERLIQNARAHGIPVDTLQHFGAFWRARAQVQLDGSYDTGTGYRGTLKTGALPVSDFTIEFGDAIGSFVCPGCGKTEIVGKRVVLRSTLAAGTAASFVAMPSHLGGTAASSASTLK